MTKPEKIYRGSIDENGVSFVDIEIGKARPQRLSSDEGGFGWGPEAGAHGINALARALVADAGRRGDFRAADAVVDILYHLPSDKPWTLFARHLEGDIQAHGGK